MTDLTGRIALVTGASRGIGRTVAIALAQAGADVAINYLERATEAIDVVETIHALGRRAIAVPADLSHSDAVYPTRTSDNRVDRPRNGSAVEMRMSRFGWGVGFEPTSAPANGFTVRPLLPLGHPSGGRRGIVPNPAGVPSMMRRAPPSNRPLRRGRGIDRRKPFWTYLW